MDQSHSYRSIDEFYISTGDKSGFYTLRHHYVDMYCQGGFFAPPPQRSEHNIHIQNLSTNWDTAIKKAKYLVKEMGSRAHLWQDYFNLEDIARNPNHGAWLRIVDAAGDHDVFPFGRYEGYRIADVYDFDYIVWFIDHLCHKQFTNCSEDHWTRCFRVALILAHGEDWEMAQHLDTLKKEEEERRKAAEEAAREPCPVGNKILIKGTIVKTDVKHTQWDSRLVMVVKDERGFLVWGSVPSALVEVAERGLRIEFVAGSLDASDADEKFGFFKRPTQARAL